jgi:hypothetical protein
MNIAALLRLRNADSPLLAEGEPLHAVSVMLLHGIFQFVVSTLTHR